MSPNDGIWVKTRFCVENGVRGFRCDRKYRKLVITRKMAIERSKQNLNAVKSTKGSGLQQAVPLTVFFGYYGTCGIGTALLIASKQAYRDRDQRRSRALFSHMIDACRIAEPLGWFKRLVWRFE